MSNQTTPFPDEAFWTDAYRIALTQGENFIDAAATADKAVKSLRERRQPIPPEHREWLLKQAKENYKSRCDVAAESRPGGGPFGGFNPWESVKLTMEALRDYDREIARIDLLPSAPALTPDKPSVISLHPVNTVITALKRMQGNDPCKIRSNCTVEDIVTSKTTPIS